MIIINPNNFSEVSSSLSGSFSGSMHGKIVSYVDENILSGSFTGSFFGAGTGSFHARELKGEIFEGDGKHVNNVFHFISSSTGEVSSSYIGSIKFMSLADLNNTYRGLEISATTLASGFTAQNLGISGWTTNNEYGAGGGSTRVHFKINDIHINEGLHPYAAFPPYIVGNGPHLGLLNGKISNKFLGQDLARLSGSSATGIAILNPTQTGGTPQAKSWNGSVPNASIQLGVFTMPTIANTELSGFSLMSLQASSNTFKKVSVNNGAIPVLGNAIDTNVFNTTTPDFSKLNINSTISDTFSSLLGPGSSFEIGLTDNDATVRFTSNQIRFKTDGSDVFFYDDSLKVLRPATGTNLEIVGDNTNESRFGSPTGVAGQFESQQITSSAMQGRWHGTPAVNNIPFDASDIDRLKHIPMCITGEISGDVYNGDWLSFGNGAGTNHTAAGYDNTYSTKSNFGIAMPAAGRIVRIVASYRLNDDQDNTTLYFVPVLLINGEYFDDDNGNTAIDNFFADTDKRSSVIAFDTANDPPSENFAAGARRVYNVDLQYNPRSEVGLPFNAGDTINFRVAILTSTEYLQGDDPPVNVGILQQQFGLWDDYNSGTDTDPNNRVKDLNFSFYFVLE